MTQHVNTQEDDVTPSVDLEWVTEVRRELNLLTEAETAALFGVARRTLQLWHQAGEGPARVKVGYLIAYRLDDLREWIDLHVQPSFKK